MKIKINKRLLPIKAHFFFFFAALGPVLPQLNVYGKQLGVSPAVMGVVTAFLPLLWAAAKPLFGYAVDYWPSQRKLIFMLLICVMTGSYCGLWFLPASYKPLNSTLYEEETIIEQAYDLNNTVYVRKIDNNTLHSTYIEKYTCHWNCSSVEGAVMDLYLVRSHRYINTIFVDKEVTNASCSELHMEFDDFREDELVCRPREDCHLLCYERDLKSEDVVDRGKRSVDRAMDNVNDVSKKVGMKSDILGEKDSIYRVVKGSVDEPEDKPDNFYVTVTFWGFVVAMCVGTVAFNVANCIGDAVCFDVLGTEGSKYGAQRAWGTAGYGLTALLGGWLVDSCSESEEYKSFTPAFIVALVATVIDLYSCRALTLPPLSSPDDGGKALRQVLKMPRVLVFITFAIVAGTFDSFIIYYMFWYIEEIAMSTGHYGQIKLIEGVIVAAQSFVGELLFFYFSGKIIKRWGYGTTMTFSLLCYGIRLFLISLIRNPWHLVFVEGIMQGPTYALCYSTIVGYAAHVAPEGYSATVQGVVAGMDDGVGFALGSLLGGQLYSRLGGQTSFLIFAAAAVVASCLHAILFATVTRETKKNLEIIEEQEEKMLQKNKIINNAIYQDTVEPLVEDKDLSSVEIR